MNDSISEYYTTDRIRAVDAKFEAQKIAFAPYAFHASLAMRDMGILKHLDAAGDDGIDIASLSDKAGLSRYGVGVLLEIGLGLGVVKTVAESNPICYRLGKVGYFLLHDEMTRVNMDFMADVCYLGAGALASSIREGRPVGLKSLGNWKTIYEGLSQLPGKASASWFAFDHYYSDNAFPDALPIVFRRPVKKLMDIGGNTAKWSIACASYRFDVEITIVDLPGQVKMAMENIREAGFENRIQTHVLNVLDPGVDFPKGHDAVWMSQFLDCFSLEEIQGILAGLRRCIHDSCDVWVLEPLWDRQKYDAASYALQATSLYFTTMANGNSKMYSYDELRSSIESAGYRLEEEFHDLGQNDYSLLRFRRTRQ